MVGTLLVHELTKGKHGLTRFTTTPWNWGKVVTWRKPPPSPLQYFVPGHGANTQMSFLFQDSQIGSFEIP
jgi:hypothetical protein